MSAPRKEKDRQESTLGRKIIAIADWAIIIVVLLIAVFIIVGYLQPVVEKPSARKIPDGRSFKVQLIGGCRRPDEVKNIAEKLRKAGIDVIEIQSAGSFTYPSSLVIDRTGNNAVADSIARLLGLSSDKVVIQKYNLMLDATIVIGLDYPTITKKLSG